MLKYLILTQIHISLENLEETDGIGLMKLSVLPGRRENYSNWVSVVGRIHYLESSVVSRHCFWTKGAQKRFTGWSREKLPSTVWVHVFDDSELIGESFLSSLPLGWKQECFAAFGSRTRQFKSSIKVRYQRGKKRKKKNQKKQNESDDGV